MKLYSTDDLLKRLNRKGRMQVVNMEQSIGFAIINLRCKLGLTQAQLAKKMGTSQSAIARAENCRYRPSTSFLTRLAKATKTKMKITFEDIPK